MEDTCPTCGAPVTIQVNHNQPWRSDVKSKEYTYTPPDLTDLTALEREVVDAVMDDGPTEQFAYMIARLRVAKERLGIARRAAAHPSDTTPAVSQP